MQTTGEAKCEIRYGLVMEFGDRYLAFNFLSIIFDDRVRFHKELSD